ncbi:hypothetical protein HUO09_05425 [Vibrio sp. Y2-5]|uniref:hypothetical protein n=1 Tax=Vibrio sp. Y2-5 TaxID=2743977 RepID=UPI0016615188|nr:hypothetical protein [Vibrio sp. Y2-5]MBD0785772.1 hypothetical protein [Vibrio sp. Y2-5]
MRVRANTKRGYLFSVEYWERQHLYTSNLPQLIPTILGYSFAKYSEVPEQMIEGTAFLGATPTRTRAINSAEDFLEELGLTYDIYSDEFVCVEDIHQRANRKIMVTGQYRFVTNHLPQLHYPYGDGRIIEIDGEFDLTTGTFKGALSFG